MPTGLDHIILGIDDLDRGIDWAERRTGVRATFGGVHPGRGTRNALLALGPGSYLEIIAPDPEQTSLSWFTQLGNMREPKLLTWAAHTPDLDALAQSAVSAAIPINGPHHGARTRPDGKTLTWRVLHLRDNRGGLLPFFIEWGRESVHPSGDAPQGCQLAHFHLQSPVAPELARVLGTLSVEVSVVSGQEPLIRARITSPKGDVEFTS